MSNGHHYLIVLNNELQIDFGGPIIDEKRIEQYFLTSIDRFTK